MSLTRSLPWPAPAFARAWLSGVLGKRRAQSEAAAQAGSPAPAPGGDAPLEEVIEALPDPVMVVGALEPDDFAGRRRLQGQ